MHACIRCRRKRVRSFRAHCRFPVQLGAIEDEFNCGFIAQLYAIEKSSIIANYIIVLASCNAGG